MRKQEELIVKKKVEQLAAERKRDADLAAEQ